MARLILILAIGLIAYLWLQRQRGQQRQPLGRWIVAAVLAVLALLYLRSPIDLIPDVAPLGFLDDLLMLLGTIWWARRYLKAARSTTSRAGQQSAPNREPRGVHWDPYAVLGVDRGATPADVTRAYREQMKRYHPDRVAGLGEELQQVAHEKTLDIQRAYEELRS